MAKIEEGMLVKAVGEVHITTLSPQGRLYEREKHVRLSRPIFGTVTVVHKVVEEVLGPMEDPETGTPILDGDGPVIGVVRPAQFIAIVQWAGKRNRFSTMPAEKLIPAVRVETAEIPEGYDAPEDPLDPRIYETLPDIMESLD